jgi:hypothetical protein
MADPEAGASVNKGTGKINNQGKQNHFLRPVFCQPKFEGRCYDLKGHIYNCKGGSHADKYTMTTKKIGNYVDRTYKHGADITTAIEQIDVSLPTIIQPSDPLATETPIQVRIWEK